VEVHPLARVSVARKLASMGGKPALRTLDKGYPFITENGNVILDTTFASLQDVPAMEKELKGVAGVMEVGLFTRRADAYYVAKSDGTFEVIKP
jgi:ribose 5-phosphate isomerase A